jgi:hypothetical protein
MSAEGPVADITRRNRCRVCNSSELESILALGPTPLANAFLRSPEEFAGERSYPLDLYFCRRCSLLQLLDIVNPDVLFRHYLYVTGTSTTMAEHTRAYAQTLVDRLQLAPADLVAEAASNDGTLLRRFAAHGVRTLGIEPARNLAAESTASGIQTVSEFFTAALARELRATHGPARVMAANNVLAHVDDVLDFMQGCRELIADDGLITIEVPYVAELVERIEYDTVYHEHLSYFSMTSLARLCEAAGLHVVDVDRLDVHGGSLRLYISRSADAHGPVAQALEEQERRIGLTTSDRYHRFAADVHASRNALVALLSKLASKGDRVAGYGAPAKGNTLLNFCRVTTELVRYTVDKNTRKIGLFTPGAHLPVRDVSALQTDPPDYIFILAWNFAEEIMKQEHAHRARGGRFIIPVPSARVI